MAKNPMPNFKEEIAKDKENLRNVRDDLKIYNQDDLSAIQDLATLPYAIALLNITGDLNVGVMIRTACIFGASKVFLFGRNFYDKRSTVGAENYVDVRCFGGLNPDLTIAADYVFGQIEHWGYTPVLIDQHPNAWSMKHPSTIFRALHNKKPCLIFGNEGRGIPAAFLDNNHIKMYIPQRGVLRSLNVSAAASIAMWEMVRLYS